MRMIRTREMPPSALYVILKRCGFPDEYCEAFVRNGVDGKYLKEVTYDFLVEKIGVKNPLEAKRFLYLFSRIVDSGVKWLIDSCSAYEQVIPSDPYPVIDQIITAKDDLYGELIHWRREDVSQWISSNPQLRNAFNLLTSFGFTGLTLIIITEKEIEKIERFKAIKSNLRKKFVKEINNLKLSYRVKGRETSRLNNALPIGGIFPVAEYLQGFSTTRSCFEELELHKEKLKINEVDHLLALLRVSFNQIIAADKKPQYLTENEFFSLFAFAIENFSGDSVSQGLALCIKNHTIDSEEMQAWRGYVSYFYPALMKLPKVDTMTTVYRAFDSVDIMKFQTVLAFFSEGRVVEWAGFVSTTTNRSKSLHHIKGVFGFLFEISSSSGRLLREISSVFRFDGEDEDEKESEVVLPPNAKYIVSSSANLDPLNPGIYVIKLCEI